MHGCVDIRDEGEFGLLGWLSLQILMKSFDLSAASLLVSAASLHRLPLLVRPFVFLSLSLALALALRSTNQPTQVSRKHNPGE